MRKILGFSIIALGIFLEITWLGFCFASIVVGILLLIFAPGILLFPFNFFLMLGLSVMNPAKYSRTHSYNYRDYSQYRTNHTQAPNDVSKYYEVLESKETDSFEVIKANYRRLMKEYHYDSLVSKGLSEDMLKFAEEKTQKINEAYTYIKKLRN